MIIMLCNLLAFSKMISKFALLFICLSFYIWIIFRNYRQFGKKDIAFNYRSHITFELKSSNRTKCISSKVNAVRNSNKDL